MKVLSVGFRPLDGESFSKRDGLISYGVSRALEDSFRPLDGESFSKLELNMCQKF